jgi:hypothetical protein
VDSLHTPGGLGAGVGVVGMVDVFLSAGMFFDEAGYVVGGELGVGRGRGYGK